MYEHDMFFSTRPLLTLMQSIMTQHSYISGVNTGFIPFQKHDFQNYASLKRTFFKNMRLFKGGNLVFGFFKEYEDILFSKLKIQFIICVSILHSIYGTGLKFPIMILRCVLSNIDSKNVIYKHVSIT